MTHEFLLQLAVTVATGAGVYAAIRADLATLHERTRNHAEQLRDIWSELK